MKKPQTFESRAQERRLLESHIREKAVGKDMLHILEAGCGRKWPLELNGIRYTLAGVDLDMDALEARKSWEKDLHETIEGDLRYVELKKDEYDVIYSSFVLEHVDGADLVLKNFSRWLKPGGIMILRIPDRNSAWGFITRLTPFWFHVFFKKYVRGNRKAGRPGHAPYPTFYDTIVSRAGIRKFCEENNFILKEEYGHSFYLRRRDFVTLLQRLLMGVIGAISLGKLASEYNNLMYVLEKAQPVPIPPTDTRELGE